MATSGTITKTIRTGYALRIVWSVGSQNVAANTSSLTATVQLVSLGASYTINSSASKNGSITINGTTYSFTFSAALTGNQVKALHSRTVTVAHNADGSKVCSFSTSCGINVTLGGTYYGTVSASGSGTLNTIPRASDFTITTPSVEINGANAVSITINRASTSFTHTMRVSLGSLARNVTGLTTSGGFTIFSTWTQELPNSTSGTASVTLTTYNGSTQIGNPIVKYFAVTVPATAVPTISTVSISESVSGLAAKFAAYVQGKSRLAVRVTAAGIGGSSVTGIRTTIQGVSYTGASITSGVLTGSGSSTISITATDSRGRTSTTTRALTVQPYSVPTISNLSGFRSNSAGSEDNDGTYARIMAAFEISPVGNRNDASYAFEYRINGASTWSSLRSGAGYSYASAFTSGNVFGADSAFEVRLTITDYFGSTSRVMEIPTAYTLVDFNESGRGLAFGKVSQNPNALEIGMEAYDRFGTRIGNGLAYYLGGGAANPDTTTEELILTSSGTPISGAFYFVRTLFYSTKSATTNRTQYAYPYNNAKNAPYYRCYYNGAWTAWTQQPIITESGSRGIWNWSKYSDGTIEVYGRFNISNAGISTAMSGWYRSGTFSTATEYAYPVTFSAAPSLEMLFQTTNSNGALVWAFSSSAENARLYLPQFYLIKPNSSTGVNGHINIFARGK